MRKELAMRLMAELHPAVNWFVRRRCTDAERKAFYAELDRLRSDPVTLIDGTEAYSDPERSRYMLRIFRFGPYLAILEFNAAKDRIRVVECELPRKKK
jgi:hypothetical protein